MTSPAAPATPHSRWLVREDVSGLASSHAKAAEAIAALHTAADVHRDRARAIGPARLPLRQRLAMRQDWPRVAWFGVVLSAASVFLGWVSSGLVARLVPVYAAVLPGVLLAMAEAGAARFATLAVKRRRSGSRAEVLLPLVPLVAASAGIAAWVSLWLVASNGTQVWAAVAFALCLTLAIAVALITSSFIGENPPVDVVPTTAGPPLPRQPPRSLHARHKRARGKLDDHARSWAAAAHRYAVTIPGPGNQEKILARLLADDEEHLDLDGLNPFDTMILCGLRDYHPAPLAADLRAAWVKMMTEVTF